MERKRFRDGKGRRGRSNRRIRNTLRTQNILRTPNSQRKSSLGYSISSRKRPEAGTLSPAEQRSFFSMVSQNWATESLPRPTSMSVPTMARTMLRRKRSALMQKTKPSAVCSQWAYMMRQLLVLTSVWSLANEVKSM